MNKHDRFSVGLLATTSVVAALALLACNGGILKPKNSTPVFRVSGVVTSDPNNNKTYATAAVVTDTSIVATGTVKVDGLVLTFDNPQIAFDSVYGTIWNSAAQFSSGNHTLTVADSIALTQQSIAATLPGNLAIQGVTPPNRLGNGNQQVKLDWFGGVNASGFVIAAVRTNKAYTGAGYSTYVTSGAASATFPREAFYQTNPNVPDTGWYYLYVYAYTGSPDSVLARVVLPVGLPSQLSDNVSFENLGGHVGMVLVAVRDSIRIAVQP